MLQCVLHVPASWEATYASKITEITDSPPFKAFMAEYKPTTVKRETELYRPFVEMANYCLKKLNSRPIVFCRDDPVIVLGSDAHRKPDVVIVEEAALRIEGRDSVDNLSENGPPDGLAFHWIELVSFWEFEVDPRGDSVPGTSDDPARIVY
jgi:hypothetical protein